jgi:peptidoglycan hydrolase-like protein with peptidoglycan-binding domain
VVLSKILAVILLSVILVGCATTAGDEPIHSRSSRLQGKVGDLEKQIQEKEGQVRDLETQLAKVRAAKEAGVVNREEVDISKATTPQQIQTALKKAGFYGGEVDGKVGPKTKDAVKEFQKANGLKVDGKVGAQTWSKLQKYLE